MSKAPPPVFSTKVSIQKSKFNTSKDQAMTNEGQQGQMKDDHDNEAWQSEDLPKK